MVRKTGSAGKIFYVQCGDGEGTTVAQSHTEAATVILLRILKKFKQDISLSPFIVVEDISSSLPKNSRRKSRIIETPAILADIGLHSMAAGMKVLLSNYEK